MNAALSWINSWWGSWRLSLMIVSLLVIISSPLISMTSVVEFWGQALKYKGFKKIACIRSHHLHLQWKFKLLVGKFTWGNKANHCWVMSTNVLFSKVCWQCPAMFCHFTPQANFPAHNLNFHWRWWNQIQTTF